MRFPGDYPADWPRLAEEAKARAGWRCERCRHPAEGPWRVFGNPSLASPCDALCRHPRDGRQRVLTVHHLDFDKANCAPWNLAVLCQVCHLAVQGRGPITQLPFEALMEDWLRPHLEGLLAEGGRGKGGRGAPEMARNAFRTPGEAHFSARAGEDTPPGGEPGLSEAYRAEFLSGEGVQDGPSL